MGRQYYGIQKSFNGNTYQVELHNTGVAANHLLRIDKLNFNYDGQAFTGWENSIMPSKCSVEFVMSDGNDFQNFINIGLDAEQEWSLKVTKNSSLFWYGRVIADQIQWNREATDTGHAKMTITAVDGLNLLDGYSMADINFSIGDRQTVINTITQILGMVGLGGFIGALDNFIQDSVQYTNANTGVGGPLDGSIRDIAFVKSFDKFGDTGNVEWMNCKEGLEAILNSFGAQILMSNGMYILRNLNAFDDADFPVIYYDKQGGDLSTSTFTHRYTIESNRLRPRFEAYPKQYNQPPLRAFEAEFDRRSGAIELKSVSNTSITQLTHDDLLTGNSPGHPIEISFTINFEWTATTASPYKYYDLRSELYVTNPSTGARLVLVNGAWVTGSISVNRTRLYESNWKSGMVSKTFVETVPEPPSGYSSLTVKLYLEELTVTISTSKGRPGWRTASTALFPFTSLTIIRQSYTTADPYEFDQYKNYISDLTAPRDTNSEHPKIHLTFYNGKKYDAGSYLAWSGSQYVEAGDWSAPWTTLEGDLPEIIANQWAGLYSDYLLVHSGDLHDSGGYMAHLSLFFNSRIWVFNGGTFDAYNDKWSGEWLGVNVVYTNVNNNGEGERAIPDDLKNQGKFKLFDQSISDIQKWISDYHYTVRQDIINQGENAPTSDPGENKLWGVLLQYGYDSIEPTLNWDVWEIAVVPVSASPYNATQIVGEFTFPVDTSGGAVIFNIPTAVGNKAKLNIKKSSGDGNAVTITPIGGQTIDGAATKSITTQYQSFTLISDNSNWMII